jgi:hypothetical protein
MSKERELLNRARYNLDREYCADLIDEIQELLAQPESLREGLREDLREEISLRDHFAGLAMQGVVVSRPTWEDTRRIALTSYEQADAMLAERSKRDE